MRIVYLGTSEFAARVLERLAAGDHRPALVVTRPDRRRGRGRRLAPPPVAVAAERLGIGLIQPDDVNADQARAAIAAAAPEVVCICAFGALIKEPLLSAHPMLNVHPSLLPRWRGAAPVERAIAAGDRETGVSIMRPTAELDAGPVCRAGREPIRADDDYGSLGARLAELGGRLLVETLDIQPQCREQPDEGVTYADKIGPSDRRLDPSAPAEQLERLVRALTPHVGAYLELAGGERLVVVRARASEAVHLPAGTLVVEGNRLLLACAQGALELLYLRPAGAATMDAAAFLRGRGRDLAQGGSLRQPQQ